MNQLLGPKATEAEAAMHVACFVNRHNSQPSLTFLLMFEGVSLSLVVWNRDILHFMPCIRQNRILFSTLFQLTAQVFTEVLLL